MGERLSPYIDRYRAWGLTLIPIAPRAKKPLIKWKTFQKREPTDEELQHWFGGNNANVGIVCGAISGSFGVLDFDSEDLFKGFAAYWKESFGEAVTDMTPVVQTRPGRHQVYLKFQEMPPLFHPVGEQRNCLPDIQGEGGYVVAPPSIHPTSGKPYDFLNDVPTIYQVESLASLAIEIPSEREAPRQARQKTEPHWVSKALEGVAAGGRDNTCIQLAGYFRSKHPLEITNSILLDFAARCTPPLDDATVLKCVKSAYSYETEELAEEAEVTPKLPELAWRGLFADCRDLVAPTTEAADEYHFATFCQVLGATLARRVHVYHATRLYPNFFVCLVGRSGLTRKDTCWNRAGGILHRLHAEQGDENPVFRMVKGIRSYEGLLDELSGHRKVRLIQVGELLTLLSKAKQDSQGNILPALTELYDCPDRVNPPVRGKPADCREPFISIMAGTTQAWLRKALTEADIHGGFANRWLFFAGTPKPPKPNPPKVNKDRGDALVEAINQVRTWADGLPNEGEIHLSDKAGALFEIYYSSYYLRCQEEGLIPTLIVRVQDYVFKLALLYAAIERSPEITADHMTATLAVGEYLEASIREVFRDFGASQTREDETRVMEYLKKAGTPVMEREMYRSLRLSARELDSVLESLAKPGLVKKTVAKNKMGRRVIFWEAL